MKPHDSEHSDHPDQNPSDFAYNTFHDYEQQLIYVLESANPTEYKNRQLETGVVKPGIFMGL